MRALLPALAFALACSDGPAPARDSAPTGDETATDGADGADGTDGAGDGTADSGAWPQDRDGDGFLDTTDCDDGDPSVHPAADERCNDRDDDCDGEIDEEAVDGQTWYADTDGDGRGSPEDPRTACAAPPGFVADDTDCDDADPLAPGAHPCGYTPSPGTGDGACEAGYGADVYDAFPGSHASFTAATAAAAPWVGEDFDRYADDALVERSSDRSRQPHLDVTSGTLTARHVSAYRRGWTDTYNFRVLAVGDDGGGGLVRWTDAAVSFRAYLWDWHSGASATDGVHAFLRYQTENDLYVASVRYDGQVTIKKKACDAYTTLAAATVGAPATRTWIRVRFEAWGTRLALSVDGVEVLAVDDPTFSWGTVGIRTDDVDVYLDEWALEAAAGP